MSHTPGPWEAERDDNRELYDIGHRRTPIGQRCVASVTFGYDEPAETEQHANAKLIAAAPELLEALSALEVAANGADYCYRKRPENFAVALKSLTDAADKARAAVEKATR